MSRDIAPLGLRMPPALKDQVAAVADSTGRSMNAVIVERLERSFQQQREAAGTSELAGALRSALSMQADTVLAFVEVINEALSKGKDTTLARDTLARLQAAMKRYASGDEQVRREVWSLTGEWIGYDGAPPPSDAAPLGYSAKQMADATQPAASGTERRNRPGRRPKRPLVGPVE